MNAARVNDDYDDRSGVWSEAEDEELKRRLRAGESVRRASKSMGRPVRECIDRKRFLANQGVRMWPKDK